MSLSEGFDQTLLAARAGGEWAWRAIYEELAPALARYARACRVPDPEDLVGDVFLRAVRSLDRFDGDARDLRAWLFAMARNAALDEHRKVARRRTGPVPVDLLLEVGAGDDAEHDALVALGERQVHETLAGLTPDQRDVLLLRILGDLTIDEIAGVMGKTAGAVKMLQARGLERIRRDIVAGAVTL